MNKSIISESLFPNEKGDFDWQEFQSILNCNPSLIEWIKESCINAFISVNSIDQTLSKRLWATNVHEFIFNELCESLPNFPEVAKKVIISTSTSGNEKNFFCFEGYIFILKKEDVISNNTLINERLRNQEAPAHVITIEYAVNEIRDQLISLHLVYQKGKQAVYTKVVPIHLIENDVTQGEEIPEVTPVKPKLANNKLGDNTAV